MQKQGLLTACKYKNFCTRQKRLAKEKNNDVCKLVKETVTVETDIPQVNDSSVTSPREWGLINKEKAACLDFLWNLVFPIYFTKNFCDGTGWEGSRTWGVEMTQTT